MSRSGSEADGKAFAALEKSVGRALERMRDLEARLRQAESRSGELEGMLKRFTSDEAEPARMVARLSRLQHENDEMRSRMEAGRAAVERLLARIRFLEEKR